MNDVNTTRANGAKKRGGVRSSHYVLHVPGKPPHARYGKTYCGREIADVNCIGGHLSAYAVEELCKRCWAALPACER